MITHAIRSLRSQSDFGAESHRDRFHSDSGILYANVVFGIILRMLTLKVSDVLFE